MSDYFDWPGEHYTTLKHMLTSARAYRDACDNPLPERDTFRRGRAVHTAILEPHRYADEFVMWDRTTKSGNMSPRSGADWEAFAAEHAGKTILTRKDAEAIPHMVAAVRQHPIASSILSDVHGVAEMGIVWMNKGHGVLCKGRLDWVTRSRVVELKSCDDPTPARFSSTAARYHYAMQLAMYEEGARAHGLGSLTPTIIAVQSKPPWDVVVFSVTGETLEHGQGEFDLALSLLRACQDAKTWPGVAHAEEVPLRLPLWAVSESDRDWSVTVTEGVA